MVTYRSKKKKKKKKGGGGWGGGGGGGGCGFTIDRYKVVLVMPPTSKQLESILLWYERRLISVVWIILGHLNFLQNTMN